MVEVIRIETDKYVIEHSTDTSWTCVIEKKHPYNVYRYFHSIKEATAHHWPFYYRFYDIPYDPESKYWDYYSVINL